MGKRAEDQQKQKHKIMTTIEELENRNSRYFIIPLGNYEQEPAMGPFNTIEDAKDAFKKMVDQEAWDGECQHFNDSLEDFKENPVNWSDTYHIVKTVMLGTYRPIIEQEKYEISLELPSE